MLWPHIFSNMESTGKLDELVAKKATKYWKNLKLSLKKIEKAK